MHFASLQVWGAGDSPGSCSCSSADTWAVTTEPPPLPTPPSHSCQVKNFPLHMPTNSAEVTWLYNSEGNVLSELNKASSNTAFE
ncbi:hypothetical protein AAFF_G00222630 [Aldrovandia affinis]|uniref:Uncharacterized protein n=1 Tax=Aldrovandia affinis TaxID=143900 RepID=A0AAD7W4P3_9TELE|nr:hypothetical protein AAFF_G00222630 [Aldrovandia affinis]